MVDPLFTDADADALAGRGYVVKDGFIGAAACRAMRDELEALLAAGAFRAARVGQGAHKQAAADVRGDRICWFRVDAADAADVDDADTVAPGPAVAAFVAALNAVRVDVARSCFLSLQDLELHAACYEPGTFYRAHKDTFVDDTRRVVSVCYYLNDEWQPADGGCLRLLTDPVVDVEPRADRLVLFQSGQVLHEVLPVARRRFSTTGWMGALRRP